MAQVRTRKRGKTFSYIFEAGKTADGKRKVVEKGGFPTKDAAYKAGVAAYNDYLHGNIGITSEKITLKDFMTAWLDNEVAVNVKASSMRTYQSNFKSRIVPHLGEVKVQELTPAMVDAWIKKLLQSGLSWSDIDFAAKKITLRQQIVYINKHGYFFTTLKTESSNRYVLIDDFLLGELKRWQVQQAKNEKHFGDSYVYVYRESDGHIERRSKSLPAPDGEKVSSVCTHNDGRLIMRNVIVAMLGNEGLNALSFRHTHATILAENGAISEGISGRLGHKNPQCTQNTYIHNTPKLQENTAEIFDKILQTRHRSG